MRAYVEFCLHALCFAMVDCLYRSICVSDGMFDGNWFYQRVLRRSFMHMLLDGVK